MALLKHLGFLRPLTSTVKSRASQNFIGKPGGPLEFPMAFPLRCGRSNREPDLPLQRYLLLAAMTGMAAARGVTALAVAAARGVTAFAVAAARAGP